MTACSLEVKGMKLHVSSTCATATVRAGAVILWDVDISFSQNTTLAGKYHRK